MIESRLSFPRFPTDSKRVEHSPTFGTCFQLHGAKSFLGATGKAFLMKRSASSVMHSTCWGTLIMHNTKTD